MIRHILFITFTNAATPADILVVKRAFLQIPQRVEGVTDVEWGINDSLRERVPGLRTVC
ncbi:Stress responsive A/B Barrel Domain protein [compost metagenome]